MRIEAMPIQNAYIQSTFASAGPKEGEGPLAKYFDALYTDELMGQDSWEKAESTLLKNTVSGALTSARLTPDEVDLLFAGDLLNQCTASAFAVKEFDIPFLGLYGACSTYAEGMCLSALMVDGGFANVCAAVTSSHFCSSEKQYRYPLEYGGVRTPTAQWTVTGSGCAVITSEPSPLRITAVTVGRMVDLGVTDANNMGGAMAPAAVDCIYRHLKSAGKVPDDYDCIVTGDLASVGTELFCELMLKKGIDIKRKHLDCGSMIYDCERQKVNAGGSGCGCIASVVSGFFAKNYFQKSLNAYS